MESRITGFWNEKNQPVVGNYHESELGKQFIDKMKLLNVKINSYSTTDYFNYGMFLSCNKTLKYVPESEIKINGIEVVGYMGYSTCRICNCENGCEDYIITQNNIQYTFPCGYFHYIIEHGVKPNEDFEQFILNLDIDSCTLPPKISDALVTMMDVVILNKGIQCLKYPKTHYIMEDDVVFKNDITFDKIKEMPIEDMD